MARNKTAQGGISLRRKVTAWLAAILLVTMLSTGIASSSKSKGFGLLFFFCSVSYTLVFSGKMLTIAFAEDTLLEKSRCV